MRPPLPRAIKKAGAFLPAALLAAFSFTILLPSLGIGPISDDFAWIETARLGQDRPWGEYLAQPAPFGYFRPLALAVFRLLWLAAGDSFPIYRLVILSANSLLCLLLFLFLTRAGLSDGAAFLGAVIFSAMPSRTEALLWLCCLNEVLAALLVAGGLYLLCFGRKGFQWLAPVLFWLALLSRESALGYVLLAILFKLTLKDISWRRTLAAVILPLVFYSAARWWAAGPAIMPSGAPLAFDPDPLAMIARALNYLVKMLVPLKSLMEVAGFGLYLRLRDIYQNPGDNPGLFLLTNLTAAAAAGAMLWLMVKQAGRTVLLPLLFSGLALAAYLPFSGTAERFLYLPSAGIAVAWAMGLDRLRSSRPRLFLVLSLGLVSAYTISLQNRIHRWDQVGRLTVSFYSNLERATGPGPVWDKVYVYDLPSTLFGGPYLSFYTVNHGWRFHWPDRKLQIFAAPAPVPDGALLLTYQPDDHSLRREAR
jgi:hypothetical protein